MGFSVQYVLILTKSGQEQAFALGREILHWLQARGVQSQILDHERFRNQTGPEGERPDLILVLGGDGTMLSVARKMGIKRIPMLGLNLGQVGFLTELCSRRWAPVLQEILQGNFFLSPRIILEYQVLRQDSLLEKGRVVNDLVVSRGGMARLAKLKVSYGQREMSVFRADGLIVCTPTGSTAYAVAAGGALLSPELEVLQLCPICPFLSGFKPVVLPSRESLEVEILDHSPDMFLTQDGQSGLALAAGDRVLISQSRERLYFAQPLGSSYVEKLKLKGYL
ncbi:MAG: NAD(+)/NADH kinase [Desulfohalobiaceae bacterium]